LFCEHCGATAKEQTIDAATVPIAKNNSTAAPSQRRQEELNWQLQHHPIAKAATVGMPVIATRKNTFAAKSAAAPSQNVQCHFSATRCMPSAPWLAVQWTKLPWFRLNQHTSW